MCINISKMYYSDYKSYIGSLQDIGEMQKNLYKQEKTLSTSRANN